MPNYSSTHNEISQGFYFENDNQETIFVACKIEDIDNKGEELLEKETCGAYCSFGGNRLKMEKEEILVKITPSTYLHISENIATSNLCCTKKELELYNQIIADESKKREAQ